MKNEKYHTVETIPKSISKSQREANSIPLAHKHTKVNFPGLAQQFQ